MVLTNTSGMKIMFNPYTADHDCHAFANSLEPDQTLSNSANMSSKF